MQYKEVPTHPLIPTLSYDDNKTWYCKGGEKRSANLYMRYPYKTTENGKIDGRLINNKTISDHEYALSRLKWSKIMKCYFKYVMFYLLDGHIYKIPGEWRLGHLSLSKLNVATVGFREDKDGKRTIPQSGKNKIRMKTISIKWRRRRFKFGKIWNMFYTVQTRKKTGVIPNTEKLLKINKGGSSTGRTR